VRRRAAAPGRGPRRPPHTPPPHPPNPQPPIPNPHVEKEKIKIYIYI